MKVASPWELFEPTTEFGQHACRGMARIGRIGYQPWLSEQAAKPSTGDPVWTQFIADECARLGVEPKPALDEI